MESIPTNELIVMLAYASQKLDSLMGRAESSWRYWSDKCTVIELELKHRFDLIPSIADWRPAKGELENTINVKENGKY